VVGLQMLTEAEPGEKTTFQLVWMPLVCTIATRLSHWGDSLQAYLNYCLRAYTGAI